MIHLLILVCVTVSLCEHDAGVSESGHTRWKLTILDLADSRTESRTERMVYVAYDTGTFGLGKTFGDRLR